MRLTSRCTCRLDVYGLVTVMSSTRASAARVQAIRWSEPGRGAPGLTVTFTSIAAVKPASRAYTYRPSGLLTCPHDVVWKPANGDAPTEGSMPSRPSARSTRWRRARHACFPSGTFAWLDQADAGAGEASVAVRTASVAGELAGFDASGAVAVALWNDLRARRFGPSVSEFQV